MFYTAVERGINDCEKNLSHNDAVAVITGGLVKFLFDYKCTGNIKECENELYYLARAANALHGEARIKCVALLGLLAALDPFSRDSDFLEKKIAEMVGVSSEILGLSLESLRS